MTIADESYRVLIFVAGLLNLAGYPGCVSVERLKPFALGFLANTRDGLNALIVTFRPLNCRGYCVSECRKMQGVTVTPTLYIRNRLNRLA